LNSSHTLVQIVVKSNAFIGGSVQGGAKCTSGPAVVKFWSNSGQILVKFWSNSEFEERSKVIEFDVTFCISHVLNRSKGVNRSKGSKEYTSDGQMKSGQMGSL
jgi:hypothetical protein